MEFDFTLHLERLTKLEKTMSAVSDAVARNTTAVVNLTTAVEAATPILQDAADDAAAVAALDVNTAQVTTEVNAINAAITPAPPSA